MTTRLSVPSQGGAERDGPDEPGKEKAQGDLAVHVPVHCKGVRINDL